MDLDDCATLKPQNYETLTPLTLLFELTGGFSELLVVQRAKVIAVIKSAGKSHLGDGGFGGQKHGGGLLQSEFFQILHWG